jgi:hypothetical protein
MKLKKRLTTWLSLRNHQVRADRDIWLASYPRAGNTWVRALFASAIQGHAVASLTELDRVLPDRHVRCPVRRLLVDTKGPVIVKTHLPSFLERSARKVIYIIRDPLDTAWSYYHYFLRQGLPAQDFTSFLQAFLQAQIWPGCWAAHARGWTSRISGALQPECLAVRYEDLVAGNEAILRQMLDFTGLTLRCSDAAQLYEWNSVGQLQAAEKAGNRGLESGWFIGGSGKAKLDPASPPGSALRAFKERNHDLCEAWGYLED